MKAGAKLEGRARGVAVCIQMRNWTPIMVAAAEGGAAAVRSLVKQRADVNACDLEGMTPLILAASLGCDAEEKVKSLLLAGALAQVRSLDGWSALDYAQERARLLEAGKNSAVVRQTADALQLGYSERMAALGVSVDRLEAAYPHLKFPDSREIREATIAELSRVTDVLKRGE